MVIDPPALPTEIAVRRSDSVYMAHGYLTKVPVGAITPFIEAFTRAGDLVVDPFAGSGMTGVAAAMTGRRAVLSDISRLGQHIGSNYVNLIDPDLLRGTASRIVRTAESQVPGLYVVRCAHCDRPSRLIKAVWSQEYSCDGCDRKFTYYAAFKAANWMASLRCPRCGKTVQRRRLKRVGETLVLESIQCSASSKQLEQQPSGTAPPSFPEFEHWPDLPIEADREMYRRSALAKHGLTSTATFFSKRNLTALVSLRDSILEIPDIQFRDKLLFAFTGILPRASKRYQWSLRRPLNAQNQTYYISPVFYEWNVFDLFERKIEAVIASDDMIRGNGPLFARVPDVKYQLTSADELSHLASASVDYVFTDPPFGSNIFYSDMNLFQEAWLDATTDRTKEAVIARSAENGSSAERYEALLTSALKECYRILKPGGWLSLVFSSSRGDVWGIAQRALKCSGLELVPDRLSSIDKGQRSVKGLASGWEGVVTTDLVFTARKLPEHRTPSPVRPPEETVKQALDEVLATADPALLKTPSRVYLAIVRRYLTHHWDLESLHFDDVLSALLGRGFSINADTGHLVPAAE